MNTPLIKTIIAALLCVTLTLSGCSTTQVITANSTPAIQASDAVPFDQILDIGILPIEPGIPENPEEWEEALIVPDVRRAESSYLAYHLKDTLELTGNWGAVRVTPQSSRAVDLEIRGAIVESDGEQLWVAIEVTDAIGEVWLEKTYEDVASKFSYEKPTEDPFQDLYNDIANDLLMVRQQKTAEEIINLKAIAHLKFASDLAPDAFQSYLNYDRRGRVSLSQLPAENDSMMQRVSRIKEQEYLFVDTLDDHYSRFYRDMRPSYDEWRSATYQEAIRLREIKKKARNRLITGAALAVGGMVAASKSETWAGQAAAAGAVGAGVRTIQSGLQFRKEAEIHSASLKELSQSLGSEISPYILDIEGRTIELNGTAQEQYVQWRGLLREIYEQETSLPQE